MPDLCAAEVAPGRAHAEVPKQLPVVLINLVPITAGGGLQNAMSFLWSMKARPPEFFRPVLICVRGTRIAHAAEALQMEYIAIGGGRVGRLGFEVYRARSLARQLRASVIFTLFGAPPLNAGRVRKVSGFAYSNIIQREVPFWSWLPFAARLRKRLVDAARLALMRRADHVILETEYLAKRAVDERIFPGCVHVIGMAPSAVVLNALTREDRRRAQSNFDLLYLAGAHPNKRIHLLANVIAILNRSGRPCRLVTTLDERSEYFSEVKRSFDVATVPEALHNIGPVAPESVGDLVSNAAAIINVAQLESFSNNWVEAWAAKVPLIATDAEWCRHSCRDAALYIDPEKPGEAADRIKAMFDDPAQARALIEAGLRRLQSLPTPGQRLTRYFDVLRTAIEEAQHR